MIFISRCFVIVWCIGVIIVKFFEIMGINIFFFSNKISSLWSISDIVFIFVSYLMI